MGRKRIAGVYLNPKTGYYEIDKIINKIRLRERTKISSIEEVEQYLAHKAEEFRKAKLFGVRPQRTFKEAAAKYLIENKHKRSIADDAMHLTQMMKFVGDKYLDQIHMGSFQEFIEKRKAQGRKTKTINLALGVVRHLLNQAASEWIDEHGFTWLAVAPKIKQLKILDARAPHPLTWDEQNRLFALLPSYLHDMCLFKVNTGTREQEVCCLKWAYERRIKELNTSVFVIPASEVKNQLPRVVVLNKIALSIIERRRHIDSDYVFSFEGSRLSRINNRAWKKACHDSGIKVRVHDLKHTFGSRLRATGVSDLDRKELLGHKSHDISDHYSSAEIGRLIDAANKVIEVDRNLPNLTVVRVSNG